MPRYSYHIEHDTEGTLPHWPNGWWSVFAITGDQIADRIRFDDKRNVTERHSWCGYLGMSETFDGVRIMIDAHEEEQAKYEAARVKVRGSSATR